MARPFNPELLRVLPAARRPAIALAAIGVAQGVATIGLAFALAGLVVSVVEHRPPAIPALLLATAFALRALLAHASETVAAHAGAAISAGLRERLVAHWLGLPAEERPDPDTAATLAAQGCSSVEPYAARFLPALVAGAVVPVLALGALVWVDWPSALIVAATLPLLPLFAALIGRATQEETQRRWQALSALSGHFLDVMRGLPTLVSYGRAERQTRTIREVSERHRDATMRTLRLAFLSSAALELLATISVALVAVTVGLRLSSGSLSLQAGLLAILLAPEAYWPIRRVGAEFHSAADGSEAIAAVIEELDCGTSRATRPDDGIGVVSAHALSYIYPGSDRLILDGIDLSADLGLTVVTGPSGVGKSTLLEILAGLRLPTSGALSTPAAHLVSQRPFLAAGTVRDNLALGNSEASERLWEALREAGLEGVVAALPDALNTRIGDDGFGLSAGQRARLVLARATLSPAPVVLLDEPTAHLDPDSAETVHALIRALADERVVIAVTHRPELLALADHHIQLRGAALEVSA